MPDGILSGMGGVVAVTGMPCLTAFCQGGRCRRCYRNAMPDGILSGMCYAAFYRNAMPDGILSGMGGVVAVTGMPCLTAFF